MEISYNIMIYINFGQFAKFIVLNRPCYVRFSFFQVLVKTSQRIYPLMLLERAAQIRKLTKFKCNTLKASEHIFPQSREILQTFVWWGARTCPHHTLTSVKFGDFAELCLRQFSTNYFQSTQQATLLVLRRSFLFR